MDEGLIYSRLAPGSQDILEKSQSDLEVVMGLIRIRNRKIRPGAQFQKFLKSRLFRNKNLSLKSYL